MLINIMRRHTHEVIQCSRIAEARFRSITLLASRFQRTLDVQTNTSFIYEGVPLARLSARRRGDLLSSLARDIVSDLSPDAIVTDPHAGVCHNGVSRGMGRAEYDWLWNGRRVECKSAQLGWNEKYEQWRFSFQGVKIHREGSSQSFDDLILIFYTPDRIYFYQHDLLLAICSTGVHSACVGHTVSLGGPHRVHDWCASVQSMLSKLDAENNKCRLIADMPIDDQRVKAAVLTIAESEANMTHAYNNIPLSHLGGPARGQRLQALVREVDRVLHPHAHFDDSIKGVCVNGWRRSQANSQYDWGRDGQRIECKSAQLSWVRKSKVWQAQFQNVKFSLHGLREDALFDELLLALYSPLGVHVLRHDFKTAVSSTGIFTATRGHNIVVRSSKADVDFADAIATVLCKLEAGGCEQLAFVKWDVNNEHCNNV